MEHERHGARQPHRFDPARAGVLDDKARFASLPPSEVFGLLNAPNGALVVDFGTGTGTYAIELATSRPDVRVIALDELQPMLDKVRQKLAAEPLRNMEPVMARSTEASALLGKVDRVLALNVLHELGDAALAEVLALLKPSGGVLFVDWNADAPRDYGPPKEHVYSPLEAQKRLEKAGFQVTGQKLFSHHYALVGRRASA